MMNKRLKRISGCMLLFVLICAVVGCGRQNNKEETYPTPIDVITAPRVFNAYSDITKITFSEYFGGKWGDEWQFLVTVTATKDTIQYRCMRSDNLSEKAPEVFGFESVCDEKVLDHLTYLLNDNNFGNWKEQEYYLNRAFGQQATLYEEPREVRWAEIGDFFNLASPLRYYGIDQNEKKFRSDYSCDIVVYTDDQQMPDFYRSYEGYGLPQEYHYFEQVFWDYIVGCTGIADWRFELSQWGKDNMYILYPYMYSDTEDRQIRYFSFLESYGGRNSAVQASLVYDGGENTVTYECAYPEKTYSVGRSGIPILYSDRQESYGILYDDGKEIEASKEATSASEVLTDMIEKYGVDAWDTESADGGNGYVRQGEFYNAKNAELAEDKNERALRSGYDALLHVVYTNGEHTEIWLQNGRLPDSYNDFRDELWDYFIPYVNQDVEAEEQATDWRKHIDAWGEAYMHGKYPYMTGELN